MLGLIAAGLPNKLIARRLEISEKTVKAHLTNIYRRIGVDHSHPGRAVGDRARAQRVPLTLAGGPTTNVPLKARPGLRFPRPSTHDEPRRTEEMDALRTRKIAGLAAAAILALGSATAGIAWASHGADDPPGHEHHGHHHHGHHAITVTMSPATTTAAAATSRATTTAGMATSRATTTAGMRNEPGDYHGSDD